MATSSSLFARFSISVLLVAAFILAGTHGALTTSEKAALGELLNRFPDLRYVATWASTSDDGQQFGGSWTDDLDSACPGSGYHFYGVHCNSGHIDGLNITEHWGYPLYPEQPFNDIAGLTSLTNLTNTARKIGTSLAETILQTIPVEHVDLPTWNFNRQNISHADAIRSLRVLRPNNLSGFVSLRSLRYADRSLTDLDLTPIRHTVEELFIWGTVDASEFSKFYNFTQLKTFTCKECSPLFYGTVVNISSETIVELDLEFSGMFAASRFDIVSSSLERLTVNCNSNVSVSDAPNLKTLRKLSNSPISGLSFPNQLEIYDIANPDPAVLPHDMANLRSLTYRSFGFSPSVLSNHLCSIASSSPNLEELSLMDVAASSDVFYLPSCLNSLALKTISIANFVPQFDINSIFQNVSSGVTSLNLVKASSNQFNAAQLPRFAQLQSFVYDERTGGLSGTLPTTFFEDLSHLVHLDISSTQLAGSIPWSGWQNLKFLSLKAPFQSWPAITSTASNLEYLSIEAYYLTHIPTDAMFSSANMIALKNFFLTTQLNGPVPAFWTQLPNLVEITMRAPFGGSIPSPIVAPRLQILDIRNNILCGTLPDFTVPTYLNLLAIEPSTGTDRMAGSIPNSWSTNLAVLGDFTMMNINHLSGSIPSEFFNHHSSAMTSINIYFTGLSGPIWNMSRGIDFQSLSIGSSLIDICASNPEIPSQGKILQCSFSQVSTCSSSCPTYWQACSYIGTCDPTPPQPSSSNIPCNQPPQRVPPPGFANPPSAPSSTSPNAPVPASNGYRATYSLAAVLLCLAALLF